MAYQIEATHVEIAPSARIGEGVRIRGEKVTIGPDVVIAAGADILCDELTLGAGCRIAPNTQITCPQIVWDEGCSTGRDFAVELNQHMRLGRHSTIGRRVQMAGQGVQAGDFFWARDDVLIGGGGNKGPDSFCVLGDRVMLVDHCYLNISDRITVGNDCGFSWGVVLLTHASGQPALDGYAYKFAPITVGDNVNLTLNVLVLPGVTIGANTMVAAGSVIIHDMPANALVAGVPAVVKRCPYPPPLTRAQQGELILIIFRDYIKTLPPKGLTILADQIDQAGWFAVQYDGETWRIGFGPPSAAHTGPQLSLDFGAAAVLRSSDTHFNLTTYEIAGGHGALMEDLRDYLRRRAIRFNTDGPFRSIPLANLKRLKSRA